MPLKTLVKVGEITSLSDARYCAGMGVEMIGFNLNPESEAFVSPDLFKEITGWLAGVKFVGEFSNTEAPEVAQCIEDYALDIIQLPGMNAELIFDINLPVILQIESFNAKEVEFLITQFGSQVSYCLLENFGEQDQVKNLAEHYPILLGKNLDEQNVNTWIESTAIKGISLKGSKEEKPGFKDYDQLADILEALETDD